MQAVEALRVAVGQGAGQEVGLLLVVALQRDPVTGADDVLQQVLQLGRVDHLAVAVRGTAPARVRPWRCGGCPNVRRLGSGRHLVIPSG